MKQFLNKRYVDDTLQKEYVFSSDFIVAVRNTVTKN